MRHGGNKLRCRPDLSDKGALFGLGLQSCAIGRDRTLSVDPDNYRRGVIILNSIKASLETVISTSTQSITAKMCEIPLLLLIMN